MKLKLDPWGKMPTQSHPYQDAGWDLYAPEDVVVPARRGILWWRHNGIVTINTGVHIQLPKSTGGFIKSRSSMFKRGILTDGLIDRGYTGEIGVTLINMSRKDYKIHKGDRIAQLVIVDVMQSSWELVDELDESERGANGFGSTGR